MRCGSMWKNNILLSLTFLGLLILTVFNLAYASLHSSGKQSSPHPKKIKCSHRLRNGGECNETSEGNKAEIEAVPSKVPLLLDVDSSTADVGAPSGSGSESNNPGDDNNGDSVNRSDDVDDISETKSGDINTEGCEKDGSVNNQNSKLIAEYNSSDVDGNENVYIRRSLKAGDIFTPHELLPVTERLLTKVDFPAGVGRGIVSSSTSPEDLADRIFGAYFLTMKRIVILKDEDIVGLDALQALAIQGDPKSSKYIVRAISKAPSIVIRQPDKELESHLPPKRSRFKLLTKKESKSRRAVERKLEKKRRRNLVMELQKKMAENRHVVVNPKTGKHKRRKRIQSFRKALLEPGCTWSYECREPHDLKTCHLKAKCANETLSNGHMNEIITPSPEEVAVPENFRRAIGVAVIDEEVEKIIESHVLLTRPENLKRNIDMESLDEYFNKLVMAHNLGTTPITPLMTDEVSKDKNSDLIQRKTANRKKKPKKDASEEEREIKPYQSQINEELQKPEFDLRHFAVPLRKNNVFTTRIPMAAKPNNKPKIRRVNRSKKNPRNGSVTSRIIKLIGKGRTTIH